MDGGISVSIRSYLPEDYSAVRRNLEQGGIINKQIDTAENLAGMVSDKSDSILVAEVDGKVVGSLFIMDNGWMAIVFRLAVRERYRERGVGTKLLRAAEERLTEKGYEEVQILVDEKKKELHDWYRRRGYEDDIVYLWLAKPLNV